MSYCVNCGVELDKTLTRCPLCDCPVINPMELINQTGPRGNSPYPVKLDMVDNAAERRFTALILSILFLLPTLICLAIELVYYHTVTWSLIVLGSAALLWIWSVVPFLTKRLSAPWLLLIDGICLCGYLKLLEYGVNGGWFMTIALPVCLYLTVLTVALVVLKRNGTLKGLYLYSAIFCSVGGLCVLIELCSRIYSSIGLGMSWSWFAVIPCLGVAFLLVFIEKSPNFKASLARRFHL